MKPFSKIRDLRATLRTPEVDRGKTATHGIGVVPNVAQASSLWRAKLQAHASSLWDGTAWVRNTGWKPVPRSPRLTFVPQGSGVLVLLWLMALALCTSALHAQQQARRTPHIGYVFPAGGQRGTAFEATVGGEFLEGVAALHSSGSGVTITVVKYDRPLPQKRANELREYLEEARKKALESGTFPAGMGMFNQSERIAAILKESGATEDEIKGFLELRKQRTDPKRQQNQQISETVTLKVEIGPDAQTGARELRLMTPTGFSNPLSFCVGTLPEERDNNHKDAKVDKAAPPLKLPVVVNGQILPGEVDRFALDARRGAHLVIAVQARDLVPYLADAVPGWFQPVAVLCNAKGKEVAYAGGFRFNPDPVLEYDVPEDGVYRLEIRDALYRGREDFVFRVTVGEIPFITSVYPLGGRAGAATAVDLTGWNLGAKHLVLNPAESEGLYRIPELGNGFLTEDGLFAVDAMPTRMEEEPNNNRDQAQQVKLPLVINGRIDPPGDVDVYAFSCHAGTTIVAEVNARRLNSPLDSWLKITDAKGRQLVFNDDWEDKSAALLTHQADSYLTFTASTSGVYYLHLGDTQGKGGPEFGYRLRISAPRPDFLLRVVPSSIAAPPGGTIPVTVYAIRKDGFAGDIAVALKDAPAGFVLNGGVVPAGQDKIRATVTFPQGPAEMPINLTVEGHATVEERDIGRLALPADDMTQAFLIHHLVPAKEFLAVVSGTGRARAPLSVVSRGPMKLRAGGTGQVVISSPFRRVPFFLTQTQLQLSEPPDGIEFQGVSTTEDGVAVTFRANGKVKPGLKGNLIVEAFIERTPPALQGKTAEKRRWSVGFLPAIPFEVVGP